MDCNLMHGMKMIESNSYESKMKFVQFFTAVPEFDISSRNFVNFRKFESRNSDFSPRIEIRIYYWKKQVKLVVRYTCAVSHNQN